MFGGAVLSPGRSYYKKIVFPLPKIKNINRKPFLSCDFFVSRKDLLFLAAVLESSYFAIVFDRIIVPPFL